MVIVLDVFFASLQYHDHDYHDLMYFNTIDAISINTIVIYYTHTHIYIHETTFNVNFPNAELLPMDLLSYSTLILYNHSSMEQHESN